MKMNIFYGLAGAAFGAALILGLSTHAEAVTDAAYREPARKSSHPMA
jgi:hypothetical protein